MRYNKTITTALISLTVMQILIAAEAVKSAPARYVPKSLKAKPEKTVSEKSAEKPTVTQKSIEKPAEPKLTPENDPISQENFRPALLSKIVFDLTNDERAKLGLKKLSQSRGLAQAAVNHSDDMAKRVYFSHNTKGIIFSQSNPRDRIAKAGYRPKIVAENIAMVPVFTSQKIIGARDSQGNFRHIIESNDRTYTSLAKTAVEEWMKSPGHRKNILDPKYRELGVGIAIGKRDGIPYVYLTQDFAG